MKSLSLCFTTALVHVSVFAQTVMVDDTFSDGSISTNSSGTGTGFYSRVATGGTVTELNGVVHVQSNTSGGARAMINSNESADTTTEESIAYLFEGINFSTAFDDSHDGDTHRTYLGVRGSHGGRNDTVDNPGEGFYVEFGFGGMSGNPDGTSTFFYMDSERVPTTLATWTFDTLKILDAGVTNAELDIEIILNKTGWSINIQGDTANDKLISFSGTHADSGIANNLVTGHAFLGNQSESPNLNMSAKRVGIPEPTTFALLTSTLALGTVLIRRKKS